MKRILALTLALVLMFTFAACKKTETPEASKPETQEPAYADALAVLGAIWDTYSEDDKFPVVGGNRSSMGDGQPGAFDLTEAEELTSSLLLPEENIAQVKSAASMIHMMNSNTFTSAVFQTDTDPAQFSQILVDAANNRQFLCGIPETIVTLNVENFVIMAFGNGELMESFKNHALELDGVTLIHEGPIVYSGGGGIAIPMG